MSLQKIIPAHIGNARNAASCITDCVTSCLTWSLCALAFFVSSEARLAHAQIKDPGQHDHYSAELEPHLVYQWGDQPWNDDGLGVGFRASIPLMQDGPVKTINNNLALSFGLDWAHFGNCGNGPFFNTNLCSANDFWIPVVVQWNFFLSDVVSLFPELGIGIQHSSWSWDGGAPAGGCGRLNGVNICGNTSQTDLQLVLWLGARFMLTKNFALTVRVGTPSLLFGASFLI